MRNIRSGIALILLLFIFSCQSTTSRLTVVDRQANVIWQAKDGGEMNWQQANRYCQELNLDGKNDWRLPDMEELEGAFKLKSKFVPPISESYWSSKIISKRSKKAGYVKFDFGVTGFRKISYPGFVRCVINE
ncbi:MAG: DUF1566 domain-containing protein [Deltaproteobacteria bacterium]|nr:DUF1566 domain-containing protein [Deltaproteobacteria bacterium]MBT4638898.1 DUF1566 domain-containing protein [Deltaproteobacteria bacterium]MBT7152720.1 DUF1566 domain-containing protein [Deltaproteobacteria bacterium]